MKQFNYTKNLYRYHARYDMVSLQFKLGKCHNPSYDKCFSEIRVKAFISTTAGGLWKLGTEAHCCSRLNGSSELIQMFDDYLFMLSRVKNKRQVNSVLTRAFLFKCLFL